MRVTLYDTTKVRILDFVGTDTGSEGEGQVSVLLGLKHDEK